MPAMRPPRSSLSLSFCSDSLDCRVNVGVTGCGQVVKQMGRAARWLRGLLAGKKAGAGESSAEHKEKRRWGFGKSFREKERQNEQQQRQRRGEPSRPEASPAVSEGRKGSFFREVPRPYGVVPPAAGPRLVDEEEQNKRAIAVAAATAAVAEAAVAAAQAAAVVVKLTSSGRNVAGLAGGKREELAVIKIQSAFRGYLARRALRALRGLVKLQALVRGNIVRKQAAETLRCMQALVRVQARAQACRAIHSERSRSEKYPRSQAGPPTPEKYEQAVRANGSNPCTLKRNSSKPPGMHVIEGDRANTAAWNWLDRWMEERYWDSREAAKKAGSFASMDDEKNAKILEVDPGKPQFSHKRSNHPQYYSNLTSDHHSHSFTTVPDSPTKDSMSIQPSVPSPVSIDMQQCLSSLRFPLEAVDFSESPQFYSASSRHANARKGPFTPSKSDCSRSMFSGYSDYPNYMSNTESSRAKVRSQSAPRQRPELDKSGSIKRPSAHGYAHHSQAALAQRSSSLHAKFANKAYPGSGRLDRLGMPLGN